MLELAQRHGAAGTFRWASGAARHFDTWQTVLQKKNASLHVAADPEQLQ